MAKLTAGCQLIPPIEWRSAYLADPDGTLIALTRRDGTGAGYVTLDTGGVGLIFTAGSWHSRDKSAKC